MKSNEGPKLLCVKKIVKFNDSRNEIRNFISKIKALLLKFCN